MRKPTFCICGNKASDQLCSKCPADQHLCYASRITQFLLFRNPKFLASSNLLCLYIWVCVGPVRKPHCWVFLTMHLHSSFILQALIDGPCSNVGRKQINFKALHLTKFTIPIGRSARYGIVKKHWEKEGITEKWNNTTWAKKIADKEKVLLV